MNNEETMTIARRLRAHASGARGRADHIEKAESYRFERYKADTERQHANLYETAADEIERLSAENARLREALRRLLDRMTDRGSIGGVDSHLRTTWFSVAEVERLRASLSETGGE